MTIQDQINKLERKLSLLKLQQSECNHVWGDPNVIKIGSFVDVAIPGRVPTVTTTVFVKIPKWIRSCTVCGLIQDMDEPKLSIKPTDNVT